MTKEIYAVPILSIHQENPHMLVALEPVPVYYDARSAAQQNEPAVIDTIAPETDVGIIEFYRAEEPGSVKVTYTVAGEKRAGWLPQAAICGRNFSGLCYAD